MFQYVTNLQYLSLRSNLLMSITGSTFQHLLKLRILDIRNNLLSAVDMASLNHVMLMDASNNPILRVDNLVIGENRKGSIFSFKNTLLNKINVCIKRRRPVPFPDTYATVYIGIGHMLECTCGYFLLQPYIVGNSCLTALGTNKCQYSQHTDWNCSNS